MTYDLGTLSAGRLWPYHPDWSTGFEIRRSFLTDITTSRNNSERRRALRDVARVSARFRANVQGDDLRDAKHYLRAWQNQPSAVPDFSRYVLTTGASSGGASTLTIASPPPWIAADRLAVLCGGGIMELVEILSVADPTVTINGTLANSWPSGSVIRPVIFGLLNGRINASRLTRGAHQIGIEIENYPGGEPVEDEGTASDTFNGYEVLTAEPDFAQTPELEHIFPVELIDFGTGRTAQFRPIDRQQMMIECEFGGLDAAAALAIEQTFLRSKGRRGAFYRPSCEKDMTLAADTSAVAYFDAVGTDLADDFGGFDFGSNDVAIEIIETNGTRTRKLITGITEVSGNSRVAFTGALSLAVATTARISWMPLVRFASDELATIWQGPNAGSIATIFQTVRQ